MQHPTTANDAESQSAGNPTIALKLDASACGDDFVSRLSNLTASTTGFDTDPVYPGYATASVRLSTTQSTPIKFWGGLADSYLVDSASLQRVGAGQVNYTSALRGLALAAGQPYDLHVAVPTGGLTPGTYGLVATVQVTATVRATGIADPPKHDCDLLISADAISLH